MRITHQGKQIEIGDIRRIQCYQPFEMVTIGTGKKAYQEKVHTGPLVIDRIFPRFIHRNGEWIERLFPEA